jgi:hypothetical protein
MFKWQIAIRDEKSYTTHTSTEEFSDRAVARAAALVWLAQNGIANEAGKVQINVIPA